MLQPPAYVLQYLVNNSDSKAGVVALQVICEHCKETDVAVFDLPWFCEHLVQCAPNGGILPVELPDKFENFVDGLLGEHVIDEMADEQLKRRTLFLLARGTLWWVTLNECQTATHT